jgi:hypothetical protein
MQAHEPLMMSEILEYIDLGDALPFYTSDDAFADRKYT